MALVSFNPKLEEIVELEVPSSCSSRKTSKMNSKVFWICLAVTWTIVLFLVFQLLQFNVFKHSQHPESSSSMVDKYNSNTRATNDSSLNITEISNDLYSFMTKSSHDLLGMKKSISNLSYHLTQATNDSSKNITKISNDLSNFIAESSHKLLELSKNILKFSRNLTDLENKTREPFDNLFKLSKKVSELIAKFNLLHPSGSNDSGGDKGSAQLYVFGGETNRQKWTSSASHFNSSTGRWQSTTDMAVPKIDSCGVVVDKKIYLFGGYSGKALKTAEIFDCDTETYSEIRSMPSPRRDCGAAKLNDFIYITGGHDDSDKLSSVIRYNIQTTRVEYVSSMTIARYEHQLIQFDGRLYAIGGHSKTVEAYNPTTDRWSAVSSTHFGHYDFGVTEYGGKIYVCSKWGFEMYSPNIDEWKALTPLNDKGGRTLVSMNNRLWALGGGPTKWVHTYNPSTGQWNQQSDMDVARQYHTSFVVYH